MIENPHHINTTTPDGNTIHEKLLENTELNQKIAQKQNNNTRHIYFHNFTITLKKGELHVQDFCIHTTKNSKNNHKLTGHNLPQNNKILTQIDHGTHHNLTVTAKMLPPYSADHSLEEHLLIGISEGYHQGKERAYAEILRLLIDNGHLNNYQ